MLCVGAAWVLLSLGSVAQAQTPARTQTPAPAAKSAPAPAAAAGAKPAAAPAEVQRFDIDEFEIQGADALPQIEVEEAVYGFLGPNRTPDDVEKARAALEKAYQAKGLQTVSVSVPPQNVERRVVVLKVTEMKVGRLRVKNAKYFDQEKIAAKAPSLKEGALPDFDDLTKDVVALNQWPDRRVTPALRAGVKPGTVDVDLNVEDSLPLHASLELNNRQTANTSPLRLTGTVRYDNLWQLGHSATLSYTMAPERLDDAQTISASYLFRVPDNDQLSFLFSAVKSESRLQIPFGEATQPAEATSPSEQLGVRAVVTLPSRPNLFHTFNFGIDYKFVEQGFRAAGTPDTRSEVTYYPLTATYSATVQGEKALTALNVNAVMGLRGFGSDRFEFDARRFDARENFFVLNGDIASTYELPAGFQAFGKVQGQWSDQPLISSEQFGTGGLDTVRGYLESESVGDTGVAGTLELRSPNLASLLPARAPAKEGETPKPSVTPLNEFRVFGFVDAGSVDLRRPLPEQEASYGLWSVGVGANIKSFDYVNGSVILALPMNDQDYSDGGDPRVLFRFWGEF